MSKNLNTNKIPLPFPSGERVGDRGLKIKVCGMKFPENIREVAALQPDYMGFIFFGKSPRNFDGEIPKLDEKIKKTGVFVNASLETILEKVEKHQFQAVQLHGEESPRLCSTLKASGVEVIKVFSVGNNFDFKALEKYGGKVNFFLFDTKGKEKGGNGIVFNWDILKRYTSKTPFFLSGGIGLDKIKNIKELFLFFKEKGLENPFYGIDVNSCFETKPGFKNVEDIKRLKENLQEQ